jgi:uncharacterized membrane protein YgdD (TMEM256/DUF423 family)
MTRTVTDSGAYRVGGGQQGEPVPRAVRSGGLAAVLGMVVVLMTVVATPGSAHAADLGLSITRPHVYQGGGVIGFGNAQSINSLGAGKLNSVMVTMAVDPASTAAHQGYWSASADGGVFAAGAAAFHGSLGALNLTGPVVGMAATPDGGGYWLVALDGGVFAFGDARFYGSMGGTPLNRPVVGMAATGDGKGYWLVASDGGIFAFGDARFHGSMGGTPLVAPVTGMAAAPGGGYWMVAADGGMFAFGDAPFYGSLGGRAPSNPVVGMTVTPQGKGYLLVTTDGTISGFGDGAPYYGSLAGGYGGDPANVPPVAAIVLTPGAGGYWLLEPDGWSYSFTNPPDRSPSTTASAIVSVANSQVANDPVRGSFCNPYGPCEAWCALFATWVWEQSGVPVPSYPFTGNIYYWAAAHTQVLPPSATPVPGDAVLYGTSPYSTATSLHVGLVMQVWPDGAIVTVEGDAGPAPSGSLAVIINGPYLPSQSSQYNGMPIYAFARF